MKIAHLVGHDSLNGVATSTKILIDAQIKAGHELMLVHSRKSWIGRQSFAGPIKMLESSFKTIPADLRATGYPIRDWGRTLVHAHGSRANKFLMVFTIADGAPAVMTAHSRQFQLPWRFAHAVVGLSRQTADYYTKRLLVSKSRMHVVPNMFDASALAPVSPQRRAEARQKLGIRRDALLLGSTGAISVRKTQIDMIRILKRLIASGLDAELLLIGGFPAKKEAMPGWHEALGDPAVAGRVHLAGPRADAMELAAAMDIFLFTSVVEEAPIAPLEAMAQEVPAVSTDVGNMADLLPAERIFAPGDVETMARAVERLARDEGLRRQAGTLDRAAVAERLSPQKILPQIDAVYRAALARSRDRGWKYFKNPADRYILDAGE
ncbi:glycosyltransferase family 4 protein [Allomesorhizobium alhagi]|jgi:glycosyltransferase involved in cell wall biosynthesis|uniref:Group 1 glycosyl transferase n=1 Tax=Mesorhizobium alhagi CCNWXJ12-2 TaxID=1107882 RepID=H0HPD0_9HYPH|nr:glycosyltransferase family 4 protein [Mesorhizobium alhagi]EHK57402.1 group 1 glycosyl transferase [Mesorhizobium alhagi CCNWXJ12-2]